MKKNVLKVFLALVAAFVLLGVGIALGTDLEPAPEQPRTAVVEPVAEEITPNGLFLAINKVRANNGLPQFKRNSLLDKSSALKCADMKANDYYEHDSPKTGKAGYTYVQDVGQQYNYAAENLNAGVFYTSEEVIDNWMVSEPHKATILDPKYTDTGFAVCEITKYPGEKVFVNHFIEPLQQVQSRQTPQTTRCTHQDYGGWASPTTTCKTY